MNKILFASGKAEIKTDGKRVFGQNREDFLKPPIQIERFELRDIQTTFRSEVQFLNNWDLSTQRAISAVRYLQTRAGVDPARLAVVGYAYYRPIDTNKTVKGRARNRRIEIIVMASETGRSTQTFNLFVLQRVGNADRRSLCFYFAKPPIPERKPHVNEGNR